MDVIARCVFGIALENLGETDDVFMRNAKAAFNPPTQKSPLALVLSKFKIVHLSYEKFRVSIIIALHHSSFPQYLKSGR